MLFPDGLTVNGDALFAGIAASSKRPLKMVGGAAGEMMRFDRTYVIRVPLRLDKANGALFFPAELRTGATVFMARRDPIRVLENAVRSAQRIADRRAGQTPLAVLQFDCTGRGRMLFGERTTADLIDPMQRALGKNIPWLGFHTYGEIAPVHGRPQYHNYTVALCALYAPHAR